LIFRFDGSISVLAIGSFNGTEARRLDTRVTTAQF
jgi:hypothetical protein